MSTITAELLTQLLSSHREELLTAIGKMLQSTPLTSSSSLSSLSSFSSLSSVASETEKPKKAKKSKKEAEAPAEPKEKKPPSPWALFTQRVIQLVKAQYEALGTPADARFKTPTIMQLASALKAKKPIDEWKDDEIKAEALTFVPPAVSKQAVAKSSKSSVGSATEPKEEPVADVIPTPVPVVAPVVAPVVTAPKKTKTTTEKAKAKPVEKPVDLSFFPWSHDGQDYYTNDRGDVATLDGEWVGRYDVKTQTIDESVPEPEDLATVTLRCE